VSIGEMIGGITTGIKRIFLTSKAEEESTADSLDRAL
jgi:hypothetical protein